MTETTLWRRRLGADTPAASSWTMLQPPGCMVARTPPQRCTVQRSSVTAGRVAAAASLASGEELSVNGVKSKVAIVTGAGTRIGAASALALAAEGAKTIFADIRLEAAEGCEARAAGYESCAAAADIGDEASVRCMID